MPIRVEHFDIVLHAFKCSLFIDAMALSPGPPAAGEQNLLISMLQQNEYFVVKLSNLPQRDTNKTLEQT